MDIIHPAIITSVALSLIWITIELLSLCTQKMSNWLNDNPQPIQRSFAFRSLLRLFKIEDEDSLTVWAGVLVVLMAWPVSFILLGATVLVFRDRKRRRDNKQAIAPTII
ncbi:hypothetical protein QN399_00820 [Pseudomonas sp. 10C3]|uniref:hypothetical protein n=1 Tax=Pseudomonas sp. 10C3 TaxID=3118753 RepID=UPI002E813205|nr:hypothetical protein [Pseudomonas sp. 10C3]MEE3504817.1 hypothetical protein [Pseudomonas sp. 10C3]